MIRQVRDRWGGSCPYRGQSTTTTTHDGTLPRDHLHHAWSSISSISSSIRVYYDSCHVMPCCPAFALHIMSLSLHPRFVQITEHRDTHFEPHRASFDPSVLLSALHNLHISHPIPNRENPPSSLALQASSH